MFIGGLYDPATATLTVEPRLSLIYTHLKTHLWMELNSLIMQGAHVSLLEELKIGGFNVWGRR